MAVAQRIADFADLRRPQIEVAAARVAFDLCTPLCRCGVVPCPQAKLKLCATCGDIKRLECRKAACVAARGPLLITMRAEEPAAITDETAAEEAPAPMMVDDGNTTGGFIPVARVQRPRGPPRTWGG